MHDFLSRFSNKSKEGIVNTQVEFGTLTKAIPLTIKLDTDPAPVEKEEIVLFTGTEYIPEDEGKRLALLACTNGKFLVLGEVDD